MRTSFTLYGMVFSRSLKIWFQLIPWRRSRVLMKTLRSSTVSFSSLWITALSLACSSVTAFTCCLSIATSWRTSPICLLSCRAKLISTPKVATSSTATMLEATIIARSRRNGWLARFIGIFISVVPGHRAQIPQQSRVVFARHSQRRSHLLRFHGQFLLEQPLRFVGARAETTEQQLFGAAAQVVFHIDERGHQNGGNIFQLGSRQFQTANQLDRALISHQQGQGPAGQLGDHGQSALRRQFQRRQRRSGLQV